MPYTDEDREHARVLYETGGMSMQKISDNTGISISTLVRWKDTLGWAKGSKKADPPPPPEPEPVIPAVEIDDATEGPPADFEVEITPPPSAALDEVEMLRAQLEAYEARAVAAEAEAAKYRPTADSPVLTEDNIDQYVSSKDLEDEAKEAVAAEERDRARRGLPKMEPGSRAFSDEVRERMAVLKLERIHNQTAHVPDDLALMIPTRKVKMINPAGTEVQVTVERQSNSADGQPMTAMKMMRDKGWKLAIVPETGGPKCLLADCYAPAGFTGDSYTNAGFCEGLGHETPFDATSRRQVETSNLSKGGELAHLTR